MLAQISGSNSFLPFYHCLVVVLVATILISSNNISSGRAEVTGSYTLEPASSSCELASASACTRLTLLLVDRLLDACDLYLDRWMRYNSLPKNHEHDDETTSEPQQPEALLETTTSDDYELHFNGRRHRLRLVDSHSSDEAHGESNGALARLADSLTGLWRQASDSPATDEPTYPKPDTTTATSTMPADKETGELSDCWLTAVRYLKAQLLDFRMRLLMLGPDQLGLSECLAKFVQLHDQLSEICGSTARDHLAKLRDKLGLNSLASREQLQSLDYIWASISTMANMADRLSTGFRLWRRLGQPYRWALSERAATEAIKLMHSQLTQIITSYQ